MTNYSKSLYNIVNYGDVTNKKNVINPGFQLNKWGQGNI
jgi:hypothetical protein